MSSPDCLLAKLLCKMYFLSNALAFDDIMTFEYLKNQNLTISRTKWAFEVK